MTAQEWEEEGRRGEGGCTQRGKSRCVALRVACVQKFESYKIIFNKINNGGQGSASGGKNRGKRGGGGRGSRNTSSEDASSTLIAGDASEAATGERWEQVEQQSKGLQIEIGSSRLRGKGRGRKGKSAGSERLSFGNFVCLMKI